MFSARKIISGIVGILMIAAVPAHAGPGFSNNFQISELFAREYGLDILTTVTVSSPMGCTHAGAVRVLMTAANYQVITSVMMTAFAGGKTIKVWVDSCDPVDGVGRIIAVTVTR
jgi:hypothetical protein